MTAEPQDSPATPTEFSRRGVLVKGAGLTAAIWAAPAVTTLGSRAMATAVGTPPPCGTTQRTITLLSTYAPDGTPDPLVQVFVGGTWVAAQAYNNQYYVPIPGTGFVNAGGTCEPPDSTFQFRAPFTLPAGYCNASISGQAQGDNNVAAVRVNSSASLASQPNDNQVSDFNNTATANFSDSSAGDFHTGVNYLYIDLHNNDCPMAVDFLATVTYYV